MTWIIDNVGDARIIYDLILEEVSPVVLRDGIVDLSTVSATFSTRFTWARRATCWPSENRITFYPLGDHEDVFANTVRHELAHIVGWRVSGIAGHDQAWRMACRILGAMPRATASSDDVLAWVAENGRMGLI